MTVASLVTKNIYVCNSAAYVFSYTFDITAASDVHLYQIYGGSATEVTAGFTVDTGNKAVTYPAAANFGADYQLVISRECSLTQELDLVNQGGFFAEVHEAEFDKLTMLAQQQQEQISRVFKLGISTDLTSVSTEFPPPLANGVPGWNSSGTALENKTDLSGVFGVSAVQQAIDFSTGKAVTLASAAEMAIGAAGGNVIFVTGTESIGAFAAAAAGTTRKLRFGAALTILYDAASLILPGKADLFVRVGDMAEFISLGGGCWFCSDFQPARGYASVKAWPLGAVEIIAHRGFAVYAPENTVVAWEQAIFYEADSLEGDVQFSSDGTAVMIHDLTVDRTTDGTGNVAELTLAELKALDAGSFYSPVFAGVTIPTFEDFLGCALKGRVRRIYPEIKGYRTTADIIALVDLVAAYSLEAKCTFQSANFGDFDYVRAVSEKVEIGFLAEDLAGFYTALELAAADGNAVVLAEYGFVLANPLVVSAARSSGVDVAVWTVEYSHYIQQLLAIGVTRFIADKRIGVLL